MRGKDLLEDMQYIRDDLVEEAMDVGYNKNVRWKKGGAAAACAAIVCLSVISFQKQSKYNFEEINDAATAEPESAPAADTTSQFHADGAVEESLRTDLPEKSEGVLEETGAGNAADTFSEKKFSDTKEFANELSKGNDYEAALDDEVIEYTIIYCFPPKQPENNDLREYAETSLSYASPQMGEYFYHQKLIDAIEYYDGANNTKDTTDAPQYAYQVVIDIFGNRVNEDTICYEQLNCSESGKALLEKEHQRLVDKGYQVSLSEEYQLTGIFTKEEFDNFEPSSNYGYVFRFESEE